MAKKKSDPNNILVGILMISIVVVLVGTLISLDTLGEFDFSDSSLTGAASVKMDDLQATDKIIKDSGNHNLSKES
tara:strand:- start:23 stop:247 length:225 start_codon:yes stop_codon:yes gene_type:complete